VPSQSYCDALTRVDLAIWKFKMFRRFYGARRRDDEGSKCPDAGPFRHDTPRLGEFQPEFTPFGKAQLVGHRLAMELFEF
jgi:hypothetical protein